MRTALKIKTTKRLKYPPPTHMHTISTIFFGSSPPGSAESKRYYGGILLKQELLSGV